MAHAQKPDFIFRRNGRVHLNRRGSQFSRLLATEVCASAVVIVDTPCSEVVWWVLATHSIRQFPLHFPSRASPCAITFRLDSTSTSPCAFYKWQGDNLSYTQSMTKTVRRNVWYAWLCDYRYEWTITAFVVNNINSLINFITILRLFRRRPLRRYFSISLLCILRKTLRSMKFRVLLCTRQRR
jgi:hypothetical protein